MIKHKISIEKEEPTEAEIVSTTTLVLATEHELSKSCERVGSRELELGLKQVDQDGAKTLRLILDAEEVRELQIFLDQHFGNCYHQMR